MLIEKWALGRFPFSQEFWKYRLEANGKFMIFWFALMDDLGGKNAISRKEVLKFVYIFHLGEQTQC